MNKLTNLTISQALEGLRSKKFTCVDLVSSYINNMEEKKHLNAYVLELREQALEQAKIADNRYSNGTNRTLEGMPIGVKDLFCTKGIRTTACSKILENFVPEYESTVTQKLLDAGAIFLGKLNMDEFAMGGSNETSCFGPVINPWKEDEKFVAGGSSGGSAAAVAANMCIAALGSDTGGSIRQPSAYCGVVGIKPTYGRCSRYGAVSYGSSLDQAGVITKNVEDSAILLEVISGYDKKDSTSTNIEVPNFEQFLPLDIKGKKIGLPKEYYYSDDLEEDVLAGWNKGIDLLKSKGADIIEVSLPNMKYAGACYYSVAFAEASSNLSKYDGLRYGLRVDGETLDDIYINTRTTGFGKEVRKRVMLGTYLLSVDNYEKFYVKAQKVRQLIRNDFDEAFKLCDMIITPTTPTPAFKIGDTSIKKDGVYYLNIANLSGLPAITIPSNLSVNGVPLGVHLIGKDFDEANILNVAQVLEQELKFVRK